MAKNQAKVQFTADCEKFNAEIKKANSTMAALRAEMKYNETQMNANGVSVEVLEDKYSLLSKQFDTSKNKVQALEGKLAAAINCFGEGSFEADKWRTALVNAKSAQEKLDQAMKSCEAEITAQKNAMKQEESATQQLTNKIEEQKSELSQLESAYSDAVLQFGKNSKEAKDLASKIDSLSGELDENQKRMEEAKYSADELESSLDELENSAQNAGDGFTVMKGAMADLLADGFEKVIEGLGNIGSEAFTMADDMTSATNTFIAKTGESKDSAGEFEDVMADIYNGNYGKSFEDIADSMATVKTSLGDLSDEELKTITTDALVLRDTFDMDVNESVRAVNSLIDQFGISADEAFNLVAQGAQNGLNQNGDLLDVINEYSVQFKNAGYGADDMFNMLANGVDAGTWSVDKLGDAVKEFNIRASDGTVGDSIKENAKAFGMTKSEAESLAKEVESGSVGAYQKLREKLLEVDDDTKRYQLGVEMFGTMWEDLGEEAVLALLNTQGEISPTTDALKEIDSVKYDNIGSAIEGIKRNLQTSVAEPIKTEVMPAVNEFIEDVDWTSVGQTVGEVFGAIAEGAVAVANGIKDATKWMSEHKGVVIAVASVIGVLAIAIGAYNTVQTIKTMMEAANVTTVWALVTAHLAQAAAVMAALAPYILIVAAIAAVIAIFVLLWNKCEGFRNFFINMWQKIKEVWSECKPYFEALWSAVTTAFSIAKDFLVARFKVAWENIKLIWAVAVDYFKLVWSSIKQVFSVVKTFFSGAFKSAWSAIKLIWSAVTGWFQNIWNTIKGIFSVVKSVLTGDFKGAWEGIKNIVSGWTSYFKNIWSGIKNVFSNVKSWFSSTFKAAWSAIKNIWSGVGSFFSGVISKVKSTFAKTTTIIAEPFRKAIDKVKSFFANLKLKFPDIKLPHFSIKGSFSLNPPSVPKLSIDWYKEGGIMMRPTIFGVNGNRLMAGGEAGPEAILPIDKLEGYVSDAVERSMNVVNLQALADAIENLASRPIEIGINGRRFATATASDTDSVSGLRNSFKNRGLVVD